MMDLTATYEVVSFSVGDTKSGTKMGKLQLKNTGDESILNCILWEETLNRLESKLFRTGNILKIISASYNEKFNNCLLTSVELIKQARLGLDEPVREELFAKILGFVELIKDDELKKFLSTLIFEHEEAFKISPAAKVMHHNYLGGLIQHTYECLEFAKSVLDTSFNKVDADLAYAACVLHDFGKVFEYKLDLETGLIDYNDEFQKEWISHSQWAFTHCMMSGFKRLAKMIAAHHGRSEWGAIVDLGQRDLEPEVYFVHHIDDLSAKYGKTSINDLG